MCVAVGVCVALGVGVALSDVLVLVGTLNVVIVGDA